MKPIIKERNERMRKKYRRLRNQEGLTQEEAIQQLMRDFSSWDLEYETVKKIVNDPTYGMNDTAPTEESTEKKEGVSALIDSAIEGVKSLFGGKSDENQPENDTTASQNP